MFRFVVLFFVHVSFCDGQISSTSTPDPALRILNVCKRTYPNTIVAVPYAVCSLQCMDYGPGRTIVPYYVDDDGISCGDNMECLGSICTLSSRVKKCKALSTNQLLYSVVSNLNNPCNFQCRTNVTTISAYDADGSSCFAIFVYLPYKCYSGSCIQVPGFSG